MARQKAIKVNAPIYQRDQVVYLRWFVAPDFLAGSKGEIAQIGRGKYGDLNRYQVQFDDGSSGWFYQSDLSTDSNNL